MKNNTFCPLCGSELKLAKSEYSPPGVSFCLKDHYAIQLVNNSFYENVHVGTYNIRKFNRSNGSISCTLYLNDLDYHGIEIPNMIIESEDKMLKKIKLILLFQ